MYVMVMEEKKNKHTHRKGRFSFPFCLLILREPVLCVPDWNVCVFFCNECIPERKGEKRLNNITITEKQT